MKRYVKASIDPQLASKIQNAAYGEDAMKYVLKYLQKTYPDKVDGYEYDGNGFDVSFQGSYDELEQMIVDTYLDAHVDITDGYQSNSLIYDNEDQEVEITIYDGNDDFTLTATSSGFYISVSNLYY